MAVKVKVDTSALEKRFTKEQLLKAVQYRGQQDLLSALLADGTTYTLAEVEKLVQDFLKKEMA